MITQERVEQLLPQKIKESTLLTKEEKDTLAMLMHSLLVSKGAETTHYLVISNSRLAKLIGKRVKTVLDNIRTLEEYDIITRVVGKSRSKGEKAEASEYHFNWDVLYGKIPLKKKTSEELFSKFIKTQETSMGTAIPMAIPTTISTTTTIPISTTIPTTTSNTKLISTSNITSSTKSITTSTTKSISKTTSSTKSITSNNCETKLQKVDIFNMKDFMKTVDEAFVGKNEDELLYKRIDISRGLDKERPLLGTNYNRCVSYLNRKYSEAVASM